MHMADALVSPGVGGIMWAATAALTLHSANKLKENIDDRRVPLMGVLGAFIFAAQMINFTIPATGSSGHLAGGMILAILLGPHAAFLSMASVLTVQALFFADGGLLALGCNIFNMGFWPCFVAYPLIYRKLTGRQPTQGRILLGSMVSCIAALQMGALGVVAETLFSGVSDLPFRAFLLLMQPIHLAIGIVEGLITSAVVTFVWKARPELLEANFLSRPLLGQLHIKGIIVSFLTIAAVTAGVFSWFASPNPDGLEWSLLHSTGRAELEAPDNGIHFLIAKFQHKIAFLPDYSFARTAEETPQGPAEKGDAAKSAGNAAWPAASAGTSVSGAIGVAMTLFLVGLVGFCLRRYQRK